MPKVASKPTETTSPKRRGRAPYNTTAVFIMPDFGETATTSRPIRTPRKKTTTEVSEGKPKTKRVPRAKKEPTVKKEPKAKKEPKPKKEPAPKKEAKPRKKRTAFKLPPEANIYLDDAMRGRVLRAMKQKMFVLSREINPSDESCEKFEVLGSIGSKYTVQFANQISCSCMDWINRRTHCKHILMVMLKVYRLNMGDPMFQSLRTTRDQRINARSSGRVVDPSVLIPANVRQRIMRYTHHSHPELDTVEEEVAERRPLDTSDCPICFEEFEAAQIETIVFCRVCGNNIHEECFNMWKQSKGNDVTCVYCRSPWVSPEVEKIKRKMKHYHPDLIYEERPNFAEELGISRKRDTSTYKQNGRYLFEE